MNKGIRYLKLPFHFDAKGLKDDLDVITSEKWLPQIYKNNYDGEWTSVALISKSGTNDTFAYGSICTEHKETDMLKNCTYFRAILDTLKCPLISARLLKLHAHSEIKPHTDYRLGYEDDNFRIHIPIITNDQVEFIIDGEKLSMLPGECWYTNVNFLHSVVNKGNQDRVHLVVDCERNDWSDKIFFTLAPKESFNLKEDQSRETTRRIIEELKRLDEPISKDLIEELEKSLIDKSDLEDNV